jgi:hypothetical protein
MVQHEARCEALVYIPVFDGFNTPTPLADGEEHSHNTKATDPHSEKRFRLSSGPSSGHPTLGFSTQQGRLG